ncbi:copper resistance CopC/CopD family protein [Streptomyces mirabilis]|uniref:copper resistance CopC/CopD family protein n=1 Tax=Streptomyces mirabilis TaxID=68239 RepID=UPI0036A75E7F
MPSAPRRARTPLTALLLVGTVLTFLLGGAGPASAHASLTRSEPADASVLKTAPSQVTLAFTESVSLSDGSLRVLSPKNERVDRGTVTHAAGKADTARVMLSGKLPEGTYTVAWRVVSSDSHPISGAFTFSIGTPSATTATLPTETPDDTAASRLYNFFRYVAYSGLALLIGVAVFLLFCWPGGAGLRPLRKLLLAGWATLFASTAILLVLRGPYETGRGLTAVFDLPLMGGTVTGRAGVALAARLLLLAAAGVFLPLFTAHLHRTADSTWPDAPVAAASQTGTSQTSRVVATDPPPGEARSGIGTRSLGALITVGLALTWAAAEHASAGIQVPLAIPVAMLHLLAMAVWLGGLVALALALYRAPADTVLPAAAVARFSRLAFSAVAVLVATGVYQSWRQVGSWDALSTTEYGKLLTFKVTAVVLVLTAAAFSRSWTAQLSDKPQQAESSVAAPQRLPVAQRVGAGGSSDSDTVEGTDSVGPPSPRDPADSPALLPGSPSATDQHWRGLRRSVAAEVVLGVVVLAITTMLTGTQPSRAAAESAAAAAVAQQPPAKVVMVPFDLGTPNGHGTVQITFAPGQVGDTTVEAVVYGPDAGISTVPELRLTLTQHAQKIGPLNAGLADRKGYWAADRLRIPLPGTWTLNVTVRVTEIDQVTVSKAMTIQPPPN